MDYEAFRQLFEDTLQAAGLKPSARTPTELLDLRSLSRTYRACLPFRSRNDVYHGFAISTEFAWEWDAVLTARHLPPGEDLLTELFDWDLGFNETKRPRLHLKIQLLARRPIYRSLPFPKSSVWRTWALSVTESVLQFLPKRLDDTSDSPAILSWCGQPEDGFSSTPGGRLILKSIHIPAFQQILLPGEWDGPDRHPDPLPDEELLDLFQRVRAALIVWDQSLLQLASDRPEWTPGTIGSRQPIRTARYARLRRSGGSAVVKEVDSGS